MAPGARTLTPAANRAALAAGSVALNALVPGLGTVAAAAYSALARPPKVHGLQIGPDVRSLLRDLQAPAVESRLRGLARFQARLENWGSCAGRGSGCIPHRDLAVRSLAGIGLRTAPACLAGQREQCRRDQLAIDLAWIRGTFQ